VTDGPPTRHLHPIGELEPPFDPRFDTHPDQRQPPQDMAAEQSCLGAMLINTDAIDLVAGVLLPSDYYRPAHEAIHDAIVDLHHRGHPVDMITVAAELQRRGELDRSGGATYLHTLAANVPIAANAGHYAGIVLEKSKLRGIVDAGTRLTQIGYEGNLGKAETYIGDALDHLDQTAMRFGNTAGATTGLHDLAWVLTGQAPEIPPPVWCKRTDGVGLFYEGKVNGLYGDPEHGKTWVAQIAAVEALHAGRMAVMVDVDHNGPNHTAARLALLGARWEHIADPNRFRYYEPEDGDQVLAAIADIIRLKPTIYILDSLGEIFPLFGVNSNDGDEVTGVMRKVAMAPADAGATVITIDHMPKGSDARATGYAIGSTAKKRMMRGSYLRVEAAVKPVPGKIGRLQLRIEKDTSGELRKACGGGYAGTLVLDSTQAHVTTWSIGDDAPKNDDGTVRPTHLMEAVSRFVEDNDQATFTAIKEGVSGKDKWIREAIRLLIEEGFMTVVAGAQRRQLHHSIALYREAEDDHIQPTD
jgi:hypothetical protein